MVAFICGYAVGQITAFLLMFMGHRWYLWKAGEEMSVDAYDNKRGSRQD
jgi:hypothetical protein